MNEKFHRVKNQSDVHDVVCAYIADNIACILNKRGIIDEEQMVQIKKKNGELFLRKNK